MGISIPGWQARAWTAPAHASTLDTDIVVAGGGLSGCAAAIAAARRGARVLVLEPTHLLGGQMSVGGVGTVDVVIGLTTTQEQGIWGEIARRVRQIYKGLGLTERVGRYRLEDSMGVNTPITDRILTELCYDAGVEIVRNCAITAADINDSRAVLETTMGTVTASVAIDATEDGSLLAQGNLPYRIGNLKGRGDQIDGDPASTRIQKLSQCAVIRRYNDGIPAGLRMTEPPTNYALYREGVAREYPGKPYALTASYNDFAGYRAYPDIADLKYYDALDTKGILRTSLNHINEVSLTGEFLTDPAVRAANITEAINRTLAIIYYLQKECRVPWAIAQDEGFREGPTLRSEGVTPDMPEWVVDMPIIPYLRESRRLRGQYTLTAKRIRRPGGDRPGVWSSQNLAVGTYPIDLHGSKGPNDFEADLGETVSDVSVLMGSFVIPFGCFVPTDNVRLVAAEKNLSMSRLASGAVRVHASVTAVGEAAGVIAALAWKTGRAPGAISYQSVQVSLLRGRALLLPYPIRGMAAGHPDYPAVSLALLNNRVTFKLDNVANQIVLTSTQMAAAKVRGRRLVAAWRGVL